MAERLRIQAVGCADAEAPLRGGLTRLGRGAACEVRIDHAEIGEHALSLDCRGGVYLVQNFCPYEIFVGQRSLPPQALCEWRIGDELRLSRSVTLTLRSDASSAAAPQAPRPATAEAAVPTPAADARRKIVPLVVTAVCVLLGIVLLMTDRGSSPAEPPDSFNDLLFALRKKQPQSQGDKIICDYLQTAWTIDRRQKSSQEREEAVRCYQRLLAEPDLRAAPLDRKSLYGRIKIFAWDRVASLSKRD
jgi:hypothetical protein